MNHLGTKQVGTERLAPQSFAEADAEKMYGNRAFDPEKKHIISDEVIEYVSILAKLELSCEEREQAKKDMEEMLDYIDKLKELDTTGVEPMTHIFPICNVFREDAAENGNDRENMLKNAPLSRDGSYQVPKTVE